MKQHHLTPEFQAGQEAFWLKQAGNLSWKTPPQTAIRPTPNGFYEWFPDGITNICHLALDVHVANGRGEQTALIFDSPVSNTKRRFTFRELLAEVQKVAAALRNSGVEKGDRVVLYLPPVPEAAICMLACARVGAIHSVVFGGFAPHELAIRIDDAKPKLIITASCGIEVDKVIPYKPMVDEAISQSLFPPAQVVVIQREQHKAVLSSDTDLDYAAWISNEGDGACEWMNSTDPLYILYTSGTTGKPKGIVRDHGGYAVALKFSFDEIYGSKPGDTFWAASDVGWVVGHSYMVYGPLIQGCTTVLYEGKPVRTPDPGAFWRMIEEYKIQSLFVAPTAIRAIRKEDEHGNHIRKYDISSLKTLFLAGERCDPSTWHWIHEQLGIPVLDHWWQTETGWPIASPVIEPGEKYSMVPGSAGVPVPGYQVEILSHDGQPLIPLQEGFISIKLPLPPGCMPGLYEDEERFFSSYLETYPGYYQTGDGGYFDEEGHLFIMGRTDDVINVSGHRLSTGEMEEIVATHPNVAECAVIGMADELRGQVPLAFVVIKDGNIVSEEQLERDLTDLIRKQIGAMACFRLVLKVQRLPKTRSGKILRRILRSLTDGEHYVIPSTIDDPAILAEIHELLKIRKIGKAFQVLSIES
ncbi:MAG TPA: AMP-binding protein [Catalimonadaceae bacterium]|nr:AMP-binding protein [Catalimonadaceae bacterium]